MFSAIGEKIVQMYPEGFSQRIRKIFKKKAIYLRFHGKGNIKENRCKQINKKV